MYENKKPKIFGTSLKYQQWYPSHYSAEEKRLVRKLDCILLTLCCLCFYIKYVHGKARFARRSGTNIVFY